MRHHEHYLGWTIEWEDRSKFDREFWICTQYIDLETEAIKTARYSVETLSTDTCKQLIKQIISDQINSARKVIALHHYEDIDGRPKPTYDDDEDDKTEDGGVNIYLA